MVIAKSDLVIMVVSASLLAAGIYRWQSNVSYAYEKRTVASTPAMTRSDSSQRSSTSSVTAKPEMTSTNVTRAAEVDLAAPVESNFGNAGQVNAVQSAPQTPSVSAENTDATANRSSPGTTTGQPLYGTHEVESGDTLSKIAFDFGTTVDKLRTINNISGSLITVGQKIRYPLPAN